MEQGGVVIPVSFRPLLDEIYSALGFLRPIYSRSLFVVHECCVIVRCGDGAHLLASMWGDEGSFDDSVERAARDLCFHLVAEYALRVEDVSLVLWEDVETMCNDFSLEEGSTRTGGEWQGFSSD